MSDSLGTGYFRLALYNAKRRDLSKAVVYARRSLLCSPENKKALRLLCLCLYEIGEFDGALKYSENCAGLSDAIIAGREQMNNTLVRARELAGRRKWRKADLLLRGVKHQSVRILTIRGCVKAAAGKHKAAASLFASAVKKDRGSSLAGVYLTGLF